MKLNNKLKLSLIAIATLTTANVNAQTLYSCIPEGCPAGQYFDGKKCIAFCPSGYIAVNMKCCKNEKKYISVSVSHKQTTPVVSNKGVKPDHITKLADEDLYSFDIFPDDYVEYLYHDYNINLLKTIRTYGKCEEFSNTFVVIK